MKKVFAILSIVFLTISVFAQTSDPLGYGMVIRDKNNNLVTNVEVDVFISISTDILNTTSLYNEIHVVTPDQNGYVRIKIGTGINPNGDFDNIPWSTHLYKTVSIDIDPNKNNGYEINDNVEEILNLTKAFYAKTAGIALNVKPDYINKIYILDSLTGPEVRIFPNRLVEEDFTRLGNYFTSMTYLYDATKLIHAASSNSLYPIGDTLTLEFTNYVEVSRVEKETETGVEVIITYSSDIVVKTYHEVVLTESGCYLVPSDPVTGELILTDITKKEVTKFFRSVIVYKEVKQ
jgi:hypothetical protein